MEVILYLLIYPGRGCKLALSSAETLWIDPELFLFHHQHLKKAFCQTQVFPSNKCFELEVFRRSYLRKEKETLSGIPVREKKKLTNLPLYICIFWAEKGTLLQSKKMSDQLLRKRIELVRQFLEKRKTVFGQFVKYRSRMIVHHLPLG